MRTRALFSVLPVLLALGQVVRGQLCTSTVQQPPFEDDTCLTNCTLSGYSPTSCPLCKSVTYNMTFTDRWSPPPVTLTGSGQYNIYYNQCDGTTGEPYAASPAVQCWLPWNGPVTSSGYFSVSEQDASCKVTTGWCGLTPYNFLVTCPAPIAPTVTKTVTHYCSYCGSTCIDNYQCPAGTSFACLNGTTATCCANCNDGSNGDCHKTTCNNACGSVCLDCFQCPPNLTYQGCGGNGPICTGTPIVLDPFDQGFHLTDIAHGVKFRVSPNGPLNQMSWTDPNWRNGWLALDRNGDGTIDNFTELFGDSTPQPPSDDRNGFRALAVFDEPANGGNGNGVIDPGDAVYSHLRVWIDANHNGISEPNELHTLQELGIFKIGLQYTYTPFVDQFGNRFRYRGTVWDEAEHGRDICYDVMIQILVVAGSL